MTPYHWPLCVLFRCLSHLGGACAMCVADNDAVARAVASSRQLGTPEKQPRPTTGSKYTQQELDNDVCRQPLWLFVYEKTVAAASLVVTLAFLGMRWYSFFTRPSTTPVSLIVLSAQTYFILVANAITSFVVLHRIRRPERRLEEMGLPVDELPTVDVLIPCLNEPVEVSVTFHLSVQPSVHRADAV